MTVKQLIEILRKKDPSLIVLVEGYEYGMEFLTEDGIKEIRFFEKEDIPGDVGGHIDELDEYKFSHPELYKEAQEAKKGLVFHR